MMRGTRFEVWCVAVLTIGCWFVAAPRSASADCVTFYVSGSSDGAFVEGSATIWLDIEGCWGEEYTGDVDAEVVVDGPGGSNFDWQSGYVSATASTFVAINGGYGTYDVDGDGYAHYVWWYFDHYSDSTSVFVPPPPPPQCRPPVVAPLMRQRIQLSSQPQWAFQWLWVAEEVDNARRDWAFLFQEHWPGTPPPFSWVAGPVPATLTIHVDYVPLVGGWGGVSPGRDDLWISPDSLGWGAVWVQQVVMHEFGHARGWGHVFTPGCSVMFTPQDPWSFTFGFLAGDHIAVEQDGPP